MIYSEWSEWSKCVTVNNQKLKVGVCKTCPGSEVTFQIPSKSEQYIKAMVSEHSD
jgi:hypothetical protein